MVRCSAKVSDNPGWVEVQMREYVSLLPHPDARRLAVALQHAADEAQKNGTLAPPPLAPAEVQDGVTVADLLGLLARGVELSHADRDEQRASWAAKAAAVLQTLRRRRANTAAARRFCRSLGR